MPSDDTVVRDFAAAQGARGLAPGIRHLIHMWMNEFGPVNVVDTMMSTLTFPGLAAANGANGVSAHVPTQVQPAAEPQALQTPEEFHEQGTAKDVADPVFEPAPAAQPRKATSAEDVSAIFRGGS